MNVEKFILGTLCLLLANAASAANFSSDSDIGSYVYVEKFGQSGQITQVQPNYLVVAFGSGSLGAQRIYSYNDGLVHAETKAAMWGERLVKAGQEWSFGESRTGIVQRVYGTHFVEVEVQGSTGMESVILDLNDVPAPASEPATIVYSSRYGIGKIRENDPSHVLFNQGETSIKLSDAGHLEYKNLAVMWDGKFLEEGEVWTLPDGRVGIILNIFSQHLLQIFVEGKYGPEYVFEDLHAPTLATKDSEKVQATGDEDASIKNAELALIARQKQQSEKETIYTNSTSSILTDAQKEAGSGAEKRPYARFQSSQYMGVSGDGADLMDQLITDVVLELQTKPNSVIDFLYDPETSSTEFLDVLKIYDYLSLTEGVTTQGPATLFFSPIPPNWQVGTHLEIGSSILTHAGICDRLEAAITQ